MSQAPFPGHGQEGEEPLPRSGMGNGSRGADRTGDADGIGNTTGNRDIGYGTWDAGRTRDAGTGPRDAVGGNRGASTAPSNGRGSWDAEDDCDQDAALDRLIADVDAGRIQIPPAEPATQGLTISLVEVTDPAAASLAGFAQGGAADSLAPGAVLLALAETACAPGTLAGLDDNQVLGVAGAARRLASLATWLELSAAGQFAGRRVSGDKPGTVAGQNLTEFAGDELAPELGMTPFAAAQHLGYARDVTRRLPATFAALRAGAVDGYQVKIVAEATVWLSGEDAAEADRILAVSAAELTYGRLRNAAARLVLMLDPQAAARRKDAAAGNARVMCFREDAGTAGLSGRDLPTAETLASWAHVKARAAAYRAAGMAGTIAALRARAFLDLLQEHDARNCPGTAEGRQASGPGTGGTAADGTGGPDTGTDRAREPRTGTDDGTGADGAAGGDGSTGGNGGTGPRPAPAGPAGPGGAARTPPAALINVTVPLAALLGQGTPGEVAGFGLIDAASTRDLAALASRHPATRWCVTVLGPDGTAAAHGCAPGRHAYDPGQHRTGADGSGNRDGPAPNRGRPAGNRDGPNGRRHGPVPSQDGPPPPAGTGQAADFLRRLKVQLAPIARGTCDHTSYEPGYRPSRKLKHLIRARTVRCHFRGCSQPAADCDADHTVAWPAGPTCQCNLGPPCVT
jgi:Domain of unknown function (DUF222)